MKPHAVSRKVVCNVCRHFCGLITDDGKGPIFDDCPAAAEKCPMYAVLRDYQPKRVRLGLAGGRSGPIDEDSGGYQSIARRAMEDG